MKTTVGIRIIAIGDYDVLVEYKGHWENDGIGKYEFWGALCFDTGMDYVVVDDIKPIFTDEAPKERVAIKVLLHENYDEYAEKISDLHGEEE